MAGKDPIAKSIEAKLTTVAEREFWDGLTADEKKLFVDIAERDGMDEAIRSAKVAASVVAKHEFP